jgi:hypothetical protein
VLPPRLEMPRFVLVLDVVMSPTSYWSKLPPEAMSSALVLGTVNST